MPRRTSGKGWSERPTVVAGNGGWLIGLCLPAWDLRSLRDLRKKVALASAGEELPVVDVCWAVLGAAPDAGVSALVL